MPGEPRETTDGRWAVRLADEARRPAPEVEDAPPLTVAAVRALLRECVTVVAPGETLIIRLGPGYEPFHVRELQEGLDDVREYRNLPFHVVVVPGDELGVAAFPPAPSGGTA